jgi:hypothetical protein
MHDPLFTLQGGKAMGHHSGGDWRQPVGHVPLVVKVAYTAFVAVLVPFYLSAYGPTNFLYFCDVALLLGLVAVWTEWSLPASMAAVGIVVPQTLWVVDFLGGLLGYHLTGMTEYMFDANIPLAARGLSLFHGWLPFFLVYLVWRLGYDRRALAAWTILAWMLVLICFFWMPAPPAPENSNVPVNINYVYGLSDKQPQTWMPPVAWLGVMLAGLPLLLFLPADLALRYLAPAVARKLPDSLSSGRPDLPSGDVPAGHTGPAAGEEEVSHVQFPGTH